MDYGRTDRADRLAAAYVAGTLRGRARRRFESLLVAHPGLRAAVRAWNERLMPLADAVPPVEPPAAVWTSIEARIDGESSAPQLKSERWWSQLAFWRGLSAFAMVAALSLALVLAVPESGRPPIVVVLSATEGAQQGVGSFVAGVSPDGRSLVTRPIVNVSHTAEQALELWSVPAQGAPRSLGLIAADRATVVQRGRILDDTAALAVSLEPAGGSKTGAPTGPVLFVGKLTS